ncbi:MAG: DNA-3-methyladenine glycosylase I [Desulfosudaceae bacterium]
MKKRCSWAGTDPVYVAYHDTEWGVPVHDDRTLFEFLVLEGTQAGLSWLTILKKRERYRQVFDNFDPRIVAGYSEAKLAALRADSGIVRNRAKIEAAVTNARMVLSIQEQFGSLARYLWNFVDGTPVINTWRSAAEVPAETDVSRALSRDLKRRGARFAGPVICYAFMQAVGMVNDHSIDCFRHQELAGTRQPPAVAAGTARRSGQRRKP